MKKPTPPDFTEINPPEIRVAMRSAWREGYAAGLRDGNPGTRKTVAKSSAARDNGAKGGRPRKVIPVSTPQSQTPQ